MDFPIKNGDFPLQNVSSPEGTKTVIDPTGLKTNRSYEVYNCEGHTIARGEHTIFSGFFKSWFGFPLLRPLWTCLKTGCFQI